MFIFLIALTCEAQTIPATFGWQNSEGVDSIHIFVWEGADLSINPLAEDSSFEFINGLGLLHFTAAHPDTQIIYFAEANGEYIQLAGFNEYGDSPINLGAALSAIVEKITIVYQEKLQGLTLTFPGEAWYSYPIDSLFLNVNEPDGSLPKTEDGYYKYWKKVNGKYISITQFRTDYD